MVYPLTLGWNTGSFKTTPSYFNWDFVYVDYSNLSSVTPVQVNVGNGVADITWGPGVDQPFMTCCEEDRCYQKEVDSYYYQGQCAPPKNMTIALWNRNDFEDETVTLTFNNGVGPGPL